MIPSRAISAFAETSATGCGSASGRTALRLMPKIRDSTSIRKARISSEKSLLLRIMKSATAIRRRELRANPSR